MSKTEAKTDGDQKDDPAIERRRINRGSTRRITRALQDFDKAIETFTKEIDLQFYAANDKGERVGEWGLVGALKAMRADVTKAVNEQLHPVADEPTKADDSK